MFCTILECIAHINEEDAVDVFQTVKILRNERMHLVQTEVLEDHQIILLCVWGGGVGLEIIY